MTIPDGSVRPSRRALLAALLVGTLFGTWAARADLGGAEQFIQDLGDRTLAVLEQPVGPQQKLDELKLLLDQSTDLELVARLVLGRYWRQATPEQQAEYVQLFKQLVMQTMAERFSWYTGETFEITGAKPVDDRDTVVSTRIFRPGATGQPIAVDWRVRSADGRYSIIDIVAEGVSMVVTQRSEVASVVSQKGMDGLIQSMKDRLQGRA